MNNIEINNIKETALLVILDSVELEKTMSHHDLFLLEYIKLDRDKSTFKSHRDFSSEKEITFKHL